MPTKHALIGPSSAHRWLMCPGSVEANRDKPWEQSPHALDGTTAHGLLEASLRADTPAEDFLHQRLEWDHNYITEAHVDAVTYALDYVHQYMDKHPKARIFIEEPVYPAKLLGTTDDIIWGTPDIQLVDYPRELVTIDYKHGTGVVVNVKDNPQIKVYHVGRSAMEGPFTRYRSVVIQPRVSMRTPVKEHSVTDRELMQWADKTVKPAIKIALKKNAPRVAGKWCFFCAANKTCPAKLAKKTVSASAEFKANPVK